MTTDKRIDRKSFLTSTAAAFSALTLGSCAGERTTRGTDETGGTDTGGANTGGTGLGGANAGGTTTGGAGISGGAGAGGSSPAGSGGTDSGGTGGDGGTGGGTFACTTETNNGTHSHPLAVPSSDVERGYQDVPYVLEDGGTGHTHTLQLTAYDFIYIQGGTPWTVESSSTLDHTHDCVITCVRH